jgi:hypothetical protein
MRKRFESSLSSLRKFGGWAVFAISLAWLAVASVAVPSALISEAKAESMTAKANRVFELRVYHALPGRMPALEAQFRDVWEKLLDKHNLKVVGYWEAEDNTFVYIVAHRSREDAKRTWDAMRADPEFQAAKKELDMADKTVGKIDSTYMEPTDFSPIR